MKPLANTLCPLCGGANTCQPAQAGHFDVPCWCTTTTISKEALARVPAEVGDKACLCPGCAAGAGDQRSREADISRG
ncbi:cysteine-rich CWC family protein [Halopseudomonas pelagia]|uniref:cysteine-rich CWC family protein n=1 Tax=Halopseudomonas pelagia TaxID=553151 RepID=UPI0009FEA6AF|nr:cysteine-rich CWC family protein [Halopseudomonas pelagia]